VELNLSSANGWIGAFITIAIAAGLPPQIVASTQTAIQVRLYVYARVSPGTVANAEAAASFILAQAGVHLVWAECRLRDSDPPKDAACELPVTPLDLQLRIIPYDMAKRVGTTGDSLGYALRTGESDAIASVYFHRALELESRNLADRAAILGGIMAHEIGHLLLAESRHSATGIMRANWGDEDLRFIAKGRLWFTPVEGLRMAAMIRNRERAFKEYKSSGDQP
jgi:hypothetical protein